MSETQVVVDDGEVWAHRPPDGGVRLGMRVDESRSVSHLLTDPEAATLGAFLSNGGGSVL